MKKIVFIPIDNRPVCCSLPEQIAGLASYKLVMPERNLLGNLTKPADIDLIMKQLENIQDIGIIVCSLDTIAYGGLIPSRRSSDSTAEIKERINRFIKIIQKHNADVYAFSSIMRISNNNINEEEKEYWSEYGTKIYEYSYNSHKTGETDFKKYGIPKDIIKDYLDTRKRNFEINKYYIELAKKNFFNTLVFSKDDCAEYGFNVKEAEELKSLSSDNKNIFVKTGADEVPIVLLSRAINKNKHIKICPAYINEQEKDKISRYEDISVEESVKSQIELAGGYISSKDECDMILLVNNFKKEQGELVTGEKTQLFTGTFKVPDKPYFIADIANANGSDNNLVKAVLRAGQLKEFYGYAAWNTTGNTLGSAISAALVYFGAKEPNREAFDILQLTRFLDDWAYQANVRAKIKGNKKNLTNTLTKQKMLAYEEQLIKKFAFKNLEIKYTFPWNRFFEIEVNISKVYTNVPFVDILFYE